MSSTVLSELDRYRPQLGTQGTVGTRRTIADIEAEIELLRGALVLPSKRRISSQDVPRREVWVVAAHDGFVVFYDDSRQEYGLGALDSEGQVEDHNVRGDLVGCFMAR